MIMFAEIVLNLPVDKTFIYKIPQKLKDKVAIGKRVIVPFGKRRHLIGYVVNMHHEYAQKYELKEIIDVIDKKVIIGDELLKLTRWIAEYYFASWGKVLACAVPYKYKRTGCKKVKMLRLNTDVNVDDIKNSISSAQNNIIKLLQTRGDMLQKDILMEANVSISPINTLIKKGIIQSYYKEISTDILTRYINTVDNKPSTTLLTLTEHQAEAINKISEYIKMQKFGVFLLHGVTGSGKTEVYLRVIEQVLNIGKSSIVLVPEISLTPQTIERFMMRFQQYGIVVLHSRLSDAERYNAWQDILHGRVRIVIGVRSAIFAPVKDLGLIVVDEEHETSYKQYDTTPRYNARDVAVVRAKYVNATVILGSATPSVETYYNAQIGKYNYISLPYRIDGRCMPEIEIIDMRKHNSYKNIFSDRLQELIHQRLLDNQQIILFLNRRGFAPFIQCRECGLIMRCPDCEITLTYHIVDTKLKCHCCGYHCEAPDTCPKCNGTNIKYIGMGTQKIVEEIHNLFPTAKVARMDVDAVAKHTHEKILNEFKMGKIDILIGTQMIAKGLDYPNVTLVGVISADVGLNIPDFRSAERTFGLLTQVAGRAGRGRLHGVVIIQTYSPEHYSVQTVVTHEYKKFYDKELKFRKQLYYPPFTHLVSIIIRGKNKETTQNTAEFITHELKMNNTDKNTEILGPAICVVSKKKGYYRYRILIKTIKTGYVKRLITYVLDKSSVHAGIDVIIDMDPVDML